MTSNNGTYFYAPDSADLMEIFQKIIEEVINASTNHTRIIDDYEVQSTGTDINLVVDQRDKYIQTAPISLDGADSAKLSFWHKFNLIPAGNGAFILIGVEDPIGSGNYKFRYVNPSPPYNDNPNIDVTRYDDYGNKISYVWNGKSAGGEFKWQRNTVDLTNFIPGNIYNPEGAKIIVRFQYFYFKAGGNNGGWWIDDIELKVSRNTATEITTRTKDMWTIIEGIDGETHSPRKTFYHPFGIVNGNRVSVDNSFYIRVDLSNVRDAKLVAYIRFNINDDTGTPPCGFRIEVSSDNGESWIPMTTGDRSGFGVSGTDYSAQKTYTGVTDTPTNPEESYYWVRTTTLKMMNCDLTPFVGTGIIIRFRVFINDIQGYIPYQDDTKFKGLYVDDIAITGNISAHCNLPMVTEMRIPEKYKIRNCYENHIFFEKGFLENSIKPAKYLKYCIPPIFRTFHTEATKNFVTKYDSESTPIYIHPHRL
jgi:hypothetical protein